MIHTLIIPEDGQPTDKLAQGAVAMLAGRRVFVGDADPRLSYAERCQQATQRYHTIEADFPHVIIGTYDDHDREVTLTRAGSALLPDWIGQRIYRNDLEASGGRSDRRREARKMLMQGRTAEAFRIDRRGGM